MLLETLAGAASAAGFMAWAVRGRSSRVFGPSVWHGARDRRALALTFDDGPSESTPALLELLAGLDVRATFFVSGAAVERLPEIARSIAAAGHEIGSHGYSHARLYLRSPAFVACELERAQEAIGRITGVTPKWYRPAYGCRWFGLGAIQRRFGLTAVMWTVIGRDWKWPARRVAARLVRGASSGGIFCLHDGRELAPRPDIRETVEAVRIAASELHRRGYRFEPVGELLRPATAP
ncbi:MAG: polysaccharide deacetylase family protein [Acidobacteria bacterium]|nr:polysaccharide deacetylase family protein [Acidobacteriota bacterium]